MTDVRYITESEPADGYTGGRIDAYTRSDRYQYVLELDASGRIIGGEWAGASRTNHPDFLWLPLGARDATVAGGAIEYARVKELVLESATVAAPAGPVSFSLARRAWRFFGPYAAGVSSVELSGTGDADLYVRVGEPVSAAAFDCRPWRSTSQETCTVSGGPVFVAVHADAAASVRLTVRAAAARLSVSGSVRAGELARYPLAVSAGRTVVVRTRAAGDVDLYARLSAAPTTDVFDARAYTASGDEEVRVVPRASGTLMIGVYGYEASSFTLTAGEE